MTLDIRGGLKNTRIKPDPYVVIDELVSNAIDSYLIRKAYQPKVEGLKVRISVEFFDRVLGEEQVDFKITCTDNGVGFGDGMVKAFVTKDTTFKDDLTIDGIAKCRGSGRIQFLHYFHRLKVDSQYLEGSELKRRSLLVDVDVKEIDENSFKDEAPKSTEIKTELALEVIKSDIYERFFKGHNLREEFSAEAMRHHVMFSSLQRLVSLRKTLGTFTFEFDTKYLNQKESSTLTQDQLPQIDSVAVMDVPYKDLNGNETDVKERFTLTHFKLDATKYKALKNSIALCAKSSVVKDVTGKYLKTKSYENNDIKGFYHIVLIESDYLNDRVNVQRDNFDIPTETGNDDLYQSQYISWDQIYDAIDDAIQTWITPPDWDKEELVKNVAQIYGVSKKMISEAKVRVQFGDSEEKVAKRVLNSYQDKIIQDTSEIFNIKEEIGGLDPTTKEFRNKVNEISWRYTASLKTIDMANLSQLVIRRAAIIEVLGMAIAKTLKVQTDKKGRREDEKVIHNIFFPTGKDIHEAPEHDIWLLNEEYQYFEYISSDKALSKIAWDGGLLFDAGIDEEMDKLLKANIDGNKAKRPDIAIFTKEGAAIIIEFKSPAESLDAHKDDLMEYAQLLAAKSKGRLKRFYGYLIGTHLNENRMTGYTKFPSDRGWFSTNHITVYPQGQPPQSLGELYSEVLFYDDIVERATKRLDVYKERLGIDLKPASVA